MNLARMLTQDVRKVAQTLFAGTLSQQESDALFEVRQSDRPDLADYQCNAAMTLAKKLGQKPRDIAVQLQTALQAELDGKATITIAGPGFINITLSDSFLLETTGAQLKTEKHGFQEIAKPSKIMIDFGGPNIAKELHVGHLRPHLIGDSLQRLMRFCGENVTSDIHMGDWGTPIGMIIAQLQSEQPDLPYFTGTGHSDYALTIEELGALYKRSKVSWDESDDFKEKARLATEALQSGRVQGYRDLWQHLRDISLDDVKEIYKRLGITFDLWLGESDVNDLLPVMLKDLVDRGIAETSKGAIIISAEKLGLENAPPLMLQKGDGGYTYAATDVATIWERVKDYGAEKIIYVVDNRQSQHFVAVFAAARLAGYAKPETVLFHAGHGTINGKDGRPFKTRDGKSVRLKDVLDIAVQKVQDDMPAVGEQGTTAEEIAQITHQISMAAVKFQEYINSRNSDYIFDIDNFTKFDGKTGPYIQYAGVRCKAILGKAKDAGVVQGAIALSDKVEREMILHMLRFPEAIEAAYARMEPSMIAAHAYALAQIFSRFYSAAPVMGENDPALRASRLQLVAFVHAQMNLCYALLGLHEPPRMLRKERADVKAAS